MNFNIPYYQNFLGLSHIADKADVSYALKSA